MAGAPVDSGRVTAAPSDVARHRGGTERAMDEGCQQIFGRPPDAGSLRVSGIAHVQAPTLELEENADSLGQRDNTRTGNDRVALVVAHELTLV